MIRRQKRPAFTLFQLLTLLALLALAFAMLLPAVQKVRESAARAQSSNNIKQMALALHNYNDVYGNLPPGVDDNHFSANAKLLPFIEQDNLYKAIDFKKSIDDKDNATARAAVVKTFINPLDPVVKVNDKWGATNYLFNDLLFSLNSKSKIPASFPDGTSNTIVIGETLKGDGSTTAKDVKRQHVLLKKDALKGIKDDAGVADFKANKHIVGDRCASWMDGRFLQGTFNGRLQPNDKRPDVSCAGLGGVSGLRTLARVVVVGLGDGSVRAVSLKISQKTWRNAMDPNDGMPLGDDW